ncbi:MAG: NAD(P)/FAD-dependent oxidoreductase [Lachnospiraceae bacterium]|nr:NAD(P)/FAD-dependent oxidoreductase [Lachnospiraceae bacterium]
MNRIVIVGGGAAGMMAACAAAAQGAEVVLLEKNEKLGRKIYITGKGRCNFTNCCETDEFFSNIPRNPRFLYSSVRGFDSEAVRNWFEDRGVRTKVERGNRAFPLSDHASDITRGLESEMRRLGVKIRLHSEVKQLLFENMNEAEESAAGVRRVSGVILSDGTKIEASKVIVATGGLSYPSTGSTGDGYRFAEGAGHKVSERTPSLVPMNTKEADIPLLQGLSLKNVTLTVRSGKKKLYSGFGEMMFTHFGITGPLVLSASADIQNQIRKGELGAEIDLKPALEEEKLNARILREFGENPNRAVHNVVSSLYPAKLIPVILERAGIDPDMPVHDVTKQQRQALVYTTKHFAFTVTSLRGYNEAVVTRGGVNVKEIDPSTMESKLVRGLYFAGEVLDVDGYTGGFNLQIAWSTGHAAGEAAAAV